MQCLIKHFAEIFTALVIAVCLMGQTVIVVKKPSAPEPEDYILIIGDSVPAINYLDYFYSAVRWGDSVVEIIGQFFGSTDITTTPVVGLAEGGARMSGGSATTIPTQYANAKSSFGVPKYVIMDGGGNDIFEECDNPSATPPCTGTGDETFWSDLISDFNSLFDTMENDGVDYVLYYGPYHAVGLFTTYNNAFDYLDENVITAFSTNHPLISWVVNDLRDDGFDTYSGQWIYDGIHPTREGSWKLASIIMDDLATVKTISSNRIIKSIPLMNHGVISIASSSIYDFPGYSNVKVLVDPSSFDGDVTFRTSASGYSNNYSRYDARIVPCKTSDSSIISTYASAYYPQITGLESEGFPKVWRSAAYTLSSSVECYGRHTSGSAGTTLYTTKAAIDVYQSGSISKTETHIPLMMIKGDTTKQGGTLSTSYTSSLGSDAVGLPWQFSSSEFDGTLTVYFEGNLANSGNAYTYAALYTSGGSMVSGSEISNFGTANTRVRSSAITLSNGETYHPRVKVSTGIGMYRDLRLIIKQENFSVTTTYWPIRNVWIQTTSTSPVNHYAAFMSYSKWFGTPYFAGGLYESNAAGTAYCELFRRYDNSEVAEIYTSSTTPVRVTTSTAPTLSDALIYYPQYRTDNASYTANSVGVWMKTIYTVD